MRNILLFLNTLTLLLGIIITIKGNIFGLCYVGTGIIYIYILNKDK